jgi:hypothetical protein
MTFHKHREDGNSNDKGRFRLISPGLAARLLSYLCFVLLCFGSALAQNTTPTNLGPIRTTFQDDVGTAIPPATPLTVGVCRRYFNTVTNQETYITSTGANCGPPSAFICGNTIVPGLPYWNGTQCVIDTGATFDSVNLVWNFEAIVSSGTVIAPKFQTSGTGGILELQAQTPPTSVPSGKYDVFLDVNTLQIGCLNSALTTCLGQVKTIASGTATMGTSAITSGACATAVTATATGTATTDRIVATPNADPTGVTGYAASASGSLYIQAFPTANTVSFKVCNNTAGTITPAALTLNWAVIR